MKNFKTKLLSFVIAAVLIFDATLTASADTSVKANAEATESSSSIASDSKLDLRPIDVKTENGATQVSRSNGNTWATTSAVNQAAPARLGSVGSAIGSYVLKSFKDAMSESLMSPITSLGSFGLGELWNILFPSSGPTMQDLQNSLNQVQSQLTEIQSEMSEMLSQLKNEDIKAELQTQISYITSSEDVASLKVALSQFSNEITIINQEPDDTPTNKQKSNDEIKFMQGIYNSKINGEDLCSAVQAFGNQVTYVNPSSGKDLFGTFDELARYSYPWENQGYAPRERFQASVLALYLQLSALSQLSLKAANKYDWDWNTSGVSAQAQYQSLLSVSKAINDMATNETVVERPSNQRYYQVPGHECLLANCTENWQANATPNITNIITTGSAGMSEQQAADDLFANGGQTSNSSLDQLKITNTRPTSDWLNKVYQDCSNDSTSLYDIFFNKDEGNFTAASGINKGMDFLMNASSDQTGDSVGGTMGPYWVTTSVVNDSDQTVQQKIADGSATYVSNSGWFSGGYNAINSWSPDGNYIGLAVLNQGVTPVNDDVDLISSVSATNGSANVTMQYPTTTELNDFTATYSVNGGTPYPLALTGISGSGSNYTLSFDAIPATSSSQSVVITISYGGKTASATAFTIDPYTTAVATVNGTNYGTVRDALNAVATSGGTVTLLGNVTESDTVTTTSGQTITMDGGNYTLTAPDNSNGNSNALTVTGGGTLILKNITLQGGSASGNSTGLEADSGFSGTVIALGTVNTNGGNNGNSVNGVENDGSGTVNVSTANGGSSVNSNGAYNGSSGVINIGAAKGTTSGVYNSSSGVINVGTATATNYNNGIYNATSGTVNANTVISDSTEQVVNGWAVGGTINVGGQVTGDGAGTINCDSGVKTVKLNEGSGASCVLDSLTIAANGNTNVGTLPAVYDANGNAGTWFTDASLTSKASSPLSSSTTNLYSTFYSSTINTATPLTDIDTPSNGTSVNGTLTVSGWALNTSGIDRVDMYAYDSNGTPHSLGSVAGSTLANRSDVAAAFANGGYANINSSGYSLAVDTTKLAGGTYTLAVAGIGKNGVVQWETKTIQINALQPLTDIDAPANGASVHGALTVSGWALNASGIDRVDMYAFDSTGTPHSLGSVAGSALANRSDVAAAFANDGYANINNSGYSLSVDTTKLAGGTYTLAVAGIGKNGVVQWETKTIAINTLQPLTDIDAPANSASVNGTLTVSGWALNASGIDRVDMYAFDSTGTPHSLGSVAGSALANRSDVAAAFANGGYANINNSGYSLSVDTTKLAGGTYTLAVAGIGKNGAVQWETKTIRVTTPQTLTDIDTPANGASVNGTLTVLGWALNASGIDRVDMYAFDSNNIPHSLGSVAGSALTNRSDVAAAFANGGYANINNSGYSLSVDTTKLASGFYTLAVAGIGKNGVVQWATKNITIR